MAGAAIFLLCALAVYDSQLGCALTSDVSRTAPAFTALVVSLGEHTCLRSRMPLAAPPCPEMLVNFSEEGIPLTRLGWLPIQPAFLHEQEHDMFGEPERT